MERLYVFQMEKKPQSCKLFAKRNARGRKGALWPLAPSHEMNGANEMGFSHPLLWASLFLCLVFFLFESSIKRIRAEAMFCVQLEPTRTVCCASECVLLAGAGNSQRYWRHNGAARSQTRQSRSINIVMCTGAPYVTNTHQLYVHHEPAIVFSSYFIITPPPSSLSSAHSTPFRPAEFSRFSPSRNPIIHLGWRAPNNHCGKRASGRPSEQAPSVALISIEND